MLLARDGLQDEVDVPGDAALVRPEAHVHLVAVGELGDDSCRLPQRLSQFRGLVAIRSRRGRRGASA